MNERSYYDALETRSMDEREASLFGRLPAQIQHAQQHTAAYAEWLGGIDAGAISDRAALATLPITRKSALVEQQRAQPPFGGLASRPAGEMRKIFASPGPIREPESARENYWRMARALFAAGLRAGDVVHNAYSYHLTPAGSMLESGAFALGCAVIPAGTGQSELQVETIAAVRPGAYVGTPSFLKILLDKAAELGTDVSSLRLGSVSGEALPESLRAHFLEQGVAVLQTYATADLGLVGYESTAGGGLILDEEIIVEIVRPGSGEPVADGQVGEVVVTVFNPDYPLLRFATGDLSAFMAGASDCGRTNRRIRGWMGRADQTTKVRGMFIRPEQVNAVAARHPEILGCRMVVTNVDHQDVLTLRVHAGDLAASRDDFAVAVQQTVRELCKVRAEVELVADGDLPNDGKVIDDSRSYE